MSPWAAIDSARCVAPLMASMSHSRCSDLKGVILTLNTARLRRPCPVSIALETRIVGWIRLEETKLVGDLGRCTAIGLLIPGFPDLVWSEN